MTSTRLLVIFSALIPILVTLYFWSTYESEGAVAEQATTVPNENLPELYMLSADTLRFDTQGNLSSRVISPLVETFRSNSKIYLTTPEIITIGPNGEAWRAEGETGEMDNSQRQISLTGNVRFRETPSRNAYAIDAISLTYDADEQKVTSEELVTISTDKHRLTSVGMIVDLKERQISLLSDVKGQHEPIR